MPLLDLRSLWERVPAVVQPASASLTLTTFAPTIATPVLVAPANASFVLTGFAPSITTTANVWITPLVVALVLTGFPPIVTGDVPKLAEGGPYVQEPGWHRRRARAPERVLVHAQTEPTVIAVEPSKPKPVPVPVPVPVAIDNRVAVAAALLAAGVIEEEQFAALLAA